MGRPPLSRQRQGTQGCRATNEHEVLDRINAQNEEQYRIRTDPAHVPGPVRSTRLDRIEEQLRDCWALLREQRNPADPAGTVLPGRPAVPAGRAR